MRTTWTILLILLFSGGVTIVAIPPERLDHLRVHLKAKLHSLRVAAADKPAIEPDPGSATRSGVFTLECKANAEPISPLIYGVGGTESFNTGATARRWGGNPTTRYNWQLNEANLAKDWFFKNSGDPNTRSYEGFLDGNKKHGVASALTVPIMGWVAKDNTSYSFPVSVFGPQQAIAPDNADAGNGVGKDGKPIKPGAPIRTSVQFSPDSLERWVKNIKEHGRVVDAYILDNEPMLWNSTHYDVHPDPTTYDELLEKTIEYAAAIRKADPTAKIAGPAEWGWLAYHYSAKDIAAGGVQVRPDRLAHGDEPLIPWYLKQIAAYEAAHKVRLLDILDVHFYPQGQGVGIGSGGQTDPATAALRIRSTKSLWDPTYVDESWINDRMRVLPLLKEWIAKNDPGLGISIGEWNFGGETHMSGGLATAEVLGRFGTEGVTSAYYWTSPAENSPAFFAFRAYRNFDGAGGRFQDWSLSAKGDAPLTSVFGSRNADGNHLVAIVLNFAPQSALSARINLQGCGDVSSSRAYTYTGGAGGFQKAAIADGLQANFPAYSINVLDLTTSRSAH